MGRPRLWLHSIWLPQHRRNHPAIGEVLGAAAAVVQDVLVVAARVFESVCEDRKQITCSRLADVFRQRQHGVGTPRSVDQRDLRGPPADRRQWLTRLIGIVAGHWAPLPYLIR